MAKKNSKKLMYFYFFMFFTLIIGGIICKRVFGHPEFMMLWHLPAAVFLVLGGKEATRENRKRYYAAKNEGSKSLQAN